MAKIPKHERLLNLVSFLLKARRPVRPSEIREKVDGYRDETASPASVERRFERDKAALRELGVPLQYLEEDVLGGPGYVIPRDAYFLPRIELTPAEAAILSAAGRFAIQGAAGPVSDALRSAVRKLQFDAPSPGDIRGTVEENFLFHRRKPEGKRSEQAILGDLTSAVLARRTVRFTYYSITRDTVGRRVVEPYGIGFANGHWYLAGYDRDREDVRVFRVDRIRKDVKRVHPDATRPEFDVPADFRIEDHVGVPPWAFGKAQPVPVRMRFDADVAFMVQMRPGPGDKWQTHDDGSATLTRRAASLDSLLTWVLGFGRHVEVLDPPTFREQVVDALKRMAAMHRGKPAKGGRA